MTTVLCSLRRSCDFFIYSIVVISLSYCKVSFLRKYHTNEFFARDKNWYLTGLLLLTKTYLYVKISLRDIKKERVVKDPLSHPSETRQAKPKRRTLTTQKEYST